MGIKDKSDTLLVLGLLGLLQQILLPLSPSSTFVPASLAVLIFGNMAVGLLGWVIWKLIRLKSRGKGREQANSNVGLVREHDHREVLGKLRKPAWLMLLLVVPVVDLFTTERVLGIDIEAEFAGRQAKSTTTTVSARQPDVYLISVDTFRADAVAGSGQAATPNLLRMRQDGVWADYALASSNQTLPSHVGMLAGVGAEVHGMSSNRDQVPRELVLLAQTFRGRGYNTCGIVTNGLLAASSGLNRGFEIWDDTRVKYAGGARLFSLHLASRSVFGRVCSILGLSSLLERATMADLWELKQESVKIGSSDFVVAQAQLVLDVMNREQRPHFMFLHMMDTHAPYRLSEQLGSMPEPYETDESGGIDTPLLARIEQDLGSNSDDVRTNARRAVKLAKRAYAIEVTRVDAAIGHLRATIEASGRPYLLLFTSDHGEHFGEHALMEHANSMYEPLLRVPFIMWGSELTPRKVEPPHLSQLAGILLSGGTVFSPPDQHLALGGKQAAIRRGSRKWIVQLADSGPQHQVMLNLSRDNGEIVDLGESLAGELVGELEHLLGGILHRRSLADTSDSEGHLSAEQRALLEYLGYQDE